MYAIVVVMLSKQALRDKEFVAASLHANNKKKSKSHVPLNIFFP